MKWLIFVAAIADALPAPAECILPLCLARVIAKNGGAVWSCGLARQHRRTSVAGSATAGAAGAGEALIVGRGKPEFINAAWMNFAHGNATLTWNRLEGGVHVLGSSNDRSPKS